MVPELLSYHIYPTPPQADKLMGLEEEQRSQILKLKIDDDNDVTQGQFLNGV